MEHAEITIGVHRSADGAPLITSDGRVVGSVEQVKALIAEYEDGMGARLHEIRGQDVFDPRPSAA